MLGLTRILGLCLMLGLAFMARSQDIKSVKLINDRPRNNELVKALSKLCDANKKAKNELRQANLEEISDKKAKVRQVNQANTENFKKLLETYQWPSVESIGNSGVECLLLLVQETQDKELRAESLPYMMNYYYIGALTGQKFALYLDRYFLRTIGYQLFGSHVNIQNNQVVFQPILDKKHVNNKRDMMGLIGIENYQKKIESVYQSNQYNMNPLIKPDATD